MFIKNSKFKKLLKDAYKNHTLNVGRTEEGVFIIESPTWHMEVLEEFLTNEIKAMIVELVGDLPAAGQAFSYRETQEVPQTMMMDCLYENLWGMVQEQDWIEMEQTRIYLQTDNNLYHVLQSKSLSKDNVYMNTGYLAAVDKKACNDGEELHGPIMNKRNKVLWYSDEMALVMMPKIPSFTGEQKLLDVTNGLDMNWQQSETERI